MIDSRTLYHYREDQHLYDKDHGEKIAIYNYVRNFLQGIYTEQLSAMMARRMWADFLERPVDESPTNYMALLDNTKEILLSDFKEIRYGFLEFIYRALIEIAEDHNITSYSKYAREFEIGLNDLFSRRGINLSSINGTITPSLDTISRKNIEDAITTAEDHATQHIRNAILALSMSKSGNADLCIRESICAVEYTVNQNLQTKTIGAGIRKLQNDLTIHKALLDSLEKLYGYTSDTSRHSIKSTHPTYEDAKLTLSLCSAWVEYLRTILPDQSTN